MVSDCANDASVAKIGANIVDIRRRASEAADGMNNFDRIGDIGISVLMVFCDVVHEK